MLTSTSVYLLDGLAILIGGVQIVGALYLLHAKRISLARLANNDSLAAEAIKVEIENLIKVSANVPALGLFLVGLALVFTGVHFSNQQCVRDVALLEERLKEAVEYEVIGTIVAADHGHAGDVEVKLDPIRKTDGEGKVSGIKVKRQGKNLPTLWFTPPGADYEAISVRLEESWIKGSDVVIPEGKVVLRKINGEGGRT